MRRALTHLLQLPLSVQGRAAMQEETRSVALLELLDADERRAFGVCAPLRGTHRETLDQALSGLQFWSSLCTSMLPLGIPSADFAVSMAEFHLRGMLFPARNRIRVAAFVQGGVGDIEALARVGAFDSRSSVKVKVGRESIEVDRRRIAALLAAMEPHARLRLDANRGMSLAACVELCQGIDADRVEYLEDPLVNPWELEALANQTGMSIALDETILEWMRGEGIPDAIAFAPSVCAHVVRLSCVGRIDRSLRHARLAHERGIRAICSTAYDSSFALRAAAIVASQLDPNADSAHGLGTADLYARDLATPPAMEGEWMETSPLPQLDDAVIEALR